MDAPYAATMALPVAVRISHHPPKASARPASSLGPYRLIQIVIRAFHEDRSVRARANPTLPVARASRGKVRGCWLVSGRSVGETWLVGGGSPLRRSNRNEW